MRYSYRLTGRVTVTDEDNVIGKGDVTEKEAAPVSAAPVAKLHPDRYKKGRYSKARDIYENTGPIDVNEVQDGINEEEIGEEVDLVDIDEDEVQTPKTPDEIAAAQLKAEQDAEFTPPVDDSTPAVGQQYDPEASQVTTGEASQAYNPEGDPVDILESPLGPDPQKPEELLTLEQAEEQAEEQTAKTDQETTKETKTGFSMDKVEDF